MWNALAIEDGEQQCCCCHRNGDGRFQRRSTPHVGHLVTGGEVRLGGAADDVCGVNTPSAMFVRSAVC